MMLFTLLLLVFNTNTHAEEYTIDSKFFLKTEENGYATNFYTFKYKNKDSDVKIKSTISYEGKDDESEIDFEINIYFANELNTTEEQETFKKYLEDKYVKPIFDKIKNGINNEVVNTLRTIYNTSPIIHLYSEDNYHFFYKTPRDLIYIESDYCDIINKELLIRETSCASNKFCYLENLKNKNKTTQISNFYKKLANKDIHQKKLIITIYDGIILRGEITATKTYYVPHFDTFEDMTTYVNDKIGENTKLYYRKERLNNNEKPYIQINNQTDHTNYIIRNKNHKIYYITPIELENFIKDISDRNGKEFVKNFSKKRLNIDITETDTKDKNKNITTENDEKIENATKTTQLESVKTKKEKIDIPNNDLCCMQCCFKLCSCCQR